MKEWGRETFQSAFQCFWPENFLQVDCSPSPLSQWFMKRKVPGQMQKFVAVNSKRAAPHWRPKALQEKEMRTWGRDSDPTDPYSLLLS